MPLKVDIQTNINELDLTIESCSEIIEMLQDTYQNLRKEMYAYFLSIKSLFKALLLAGIPLFLFVLSRDDLFAYMIPLSIVFSMIFSIVNAEMITTQTRRQLLEQIKHYQQTKDKLMKSLSKV